MTNSPDLPDVLHDSSPDVTGSVSLVLWTALVRRLTAAGVVSTADVADMLKEAHGEFAREPGGEPAMALLARLTMNVP